MTDFPNITVTANSAVGTYLLVHDPYVAAAIAWAVAMLVVLIALGLIAIIFLARGVRAVEAGVAARQAEYEAAATRPLTSPGDVEAGTYGSYAEWIVKRAAGKARDERLRLEYEAATNADVLKVANVP